jgi:hypothetical protein
VSTLSIGESFKARSRISITTVGRGTVANIVEHVALLLMDRGERRRRRGQDRGDARRHQDLATPACRR